MTETEITITEENVPDQVQTERALEDMISTNQVAIENITAKLRDKNAMLKDAYINDSLYKEAEEKVQEAKNALAVVKIQISKQPAIMQIVEDLKDMRQDRKERKAALSDYVLELQRFTGITQLELFDETYEIVKTAKLVKKAKSRK